MRNAAWMAGAFLAVLAQTLAAQAAAPDKSPDAVKASAHNPTFSDKTLWPMLTGKEYFLKETWPKAVIGGEITQADAARGAVGIPAKVIRYRWKNAGGVDPACILPPAPLRNSI
jgi:opacity protein-like surface antigen